MLEYIPKIIHAVILFIIVHGVLSYIYKVYVGKITLKRSIVDGLFAVGFFVGLIFAIYYLAVLFYPFIEIGVVIGIIMTFLLVVGVYMHIVEKMPLKEAIKGGLGIGLITSFIIGILMLTWIL